MLRSREVYVLIMKGSRDTPSKGTAQTEVERPLPPGYYLHRSDPEGLTLRSSEAAAAVARFRARGSVVESVEREAWEDHGQRNS
jgi:hypothetical protein